MLSIFDGVRDLTLAAVFVRMILAVVCGGVIGMERSMNRRAAGFRTHILVCLGASMTTLTSQYLFLYMHYYTDMARLGAQVIAGIGFLGAGTIIISRQRIKGLTTAAGLWASAIIGLAIGAGFYEGAILATILVELTATVFLKLEKQVLTRTSNIHIFLEYNKPSALENVLDYCHKQEIRIMQLEISRGKEPKDATIALISVRLPRQMKATAALNAIVNIEGVVLAEEF
ncbi:MAG: MgtC/SapB family protein [Peptococcaceae bacterium]|nr:MgtC/SapB family protein [Peptococcaceae bacterium]